MSSDIHITKVSTMVLRGKDSHGLGGVPRTWHFIVVKVETNNGLYGYGECPHWQRGYFGVRETIDYIGERLIGANPFDVKKIVGEHFNGARPPHQPSHLEVRLYLLDDLGYVRDRNGFTRYYWNNQDFQYIHYLVKFRDKVPVYLDRSGPEDVTDLNEWLTEET